MVVVQKLQPCLLAQSAERVHKADELGKAGVAGPVGFVHVRNGDVLKTQLDMVGDGAEHVRLHDIKRAMAGHCLKACVIEHRADVLGAVVKEPGKLHAVIAQLLELMQYGLHVRGHAVARRVQLVGNGNAFHWLLLSDYLKYTGLPVLADS